MDISIFESIIELLDTLYALAVGVGGLWALMVLIFSIDAAYHEYHDEVDN